MMGWDGMDGETERDGRERERWEREKERKFRK
jgi:hypothetical protein